MTVEHVAHHHTIHLAHSIVIAMKAKRTFHIMVFLHIFYSGGATSLFICRSKSCENTNCNHDPRGAPIQWPVPPHSREACSPEQEPPPGGVPLLICPPQAVGVARVRELQLPPTRGKLTQDQPTQRQKGKCRMNSPSPSFFEIHLCF